MALQPVLGAAWTPAARQCVWHRLAAGKHALARDPSVHHLPSSTSSCRLHMHSGGRSLAPAPCAQICCRSCLLARRVLINWLNSALSLNQRAPSLSRLQARPASSSAGEMSAPPAPPVLFQGVDKSSFGYKLLAASGWQEGQGLVRAFGVASRLVARCTHGVEARQHKIVEQCVGDVQNARAAPLSPAPATDIGASPPPCLPIYRALRNRVLQST